MSDALRAEANSATGPQPFGPGETPPEGFEDQVNPNPAPEGTEEELIAGKFKSQEDLVKAYEELQKKLGQRTSQDTPEGEAEGDEDAGQESGPEDPSLAEARETLKSRGLDMDAFSAEIEKDGKLSDESYESLAKAGYPKFMVDAYVRGLQADPDAVRESVRASDAQVAEIKAVAGGDEGYAEMVTWAAENLPEAEVEAFNNAVDGDPTVAKLAVQGLKAKFDAEADRESKLLQGGARAGRDVYRSRQEQMADMADPRYGVDPAYTRDVEQKSMRSEF